VGSEMCIRDRLLGCESLGVLGEKPVVPKGADASEPVLFITVTYLRGDGIRGEKLFRSFFE
jgi:hypothetical protein